MCARPIELVVLLRSRFARRTWHLTSAPSLTSPCPPPESSLIIIDDGQFGGESTYEATTAQYTYWRLLRVAEKVARAIHPLSTWCICRAAIMVDKLHPRAGPSSNRVTRTRSPDRRRAKPEATECRPSRSSVEQRRTVLA